MTRVAGVDPGTVSFDVCVLDDGEVILERSFSTEAVGADPAPLVETLTGHGPYDLVLGPAGYGLPLVPAERVGERELELMVLLRADEPRAPCRHRRDAHDHRARSSPPAFRSCSGRGRSTCRRSRPTGSGTASTWGPRTRSPARRSASPTSHAGWASTVADTSFVMLELGGAFSAALAVDAGRIVDGLGGSAGPIGARACGALDAEVAYLLGAALSKRTVFSGGALDPRGELDLAEARDREGWLALEEGAAKAALALTVSAPAPREILVTGRLAHAPGVLEALGERLATVAPVRSVAKAAAQGAAVLADGLAGGRYAALVDRLGVRDASGSALDHLRLHGADRIRLR